MSELAESEVAGHARPADLAAQPQTVSQGAPHAAHQAPWRGSDLAAALGGRSIVLVGMMGAGKTSVGKRLSQRLGIPFVDADAEIERAASATIPEIFARHGEPFFRDREQHVVARLLREPSLKVLATGGGAYMQPATRADIHALGIAIWLKADADVLMRRVKKRANRPLLANADPEGTLRRLVDERYPIYAQADCVVISQDGPHDQVVDAVIEALHSHLGTGARGPYAAPSADDAPPMPGAPSQDLG